ncbi:hypothetical protein COHA_001134 [Chlorella ohadii]|uniref:Uncharacterized protein n=1 Tax=Chlorella ohadii TaxID=2649997 RepID=A0AAD5DYB2_9CHLO|nr:hypothetical protein COHA_001134 [Chlorella ohadii]
MASSHPQTFMRLGFNVFLSGIAPLIINGTFSWWTQSSWLPDPLMRIRMANIHRGKHGSDSETFDTEGRFVPQKARSGLLPGGAGGAWWDLHIKSASQRCLGHHLRFEEIYSKYDKGNKGGLTLQEVQVTYYLCAKDTPRGRLLMKDDARGAIDGTIFYRVAQEVEAGRLKMRQTKGGMDRTDRRPAGTAAQKAE